MTSWDHTEGRWKDHTEAIIDEAVINYIQLGHRISSFTLICGENVCRRGLMLLCWVHDDYSLSPVGRKMVLSVLCQSLILLLPWCIAELFVLFVCGENVHRRSLMVLTQEKTLRGWACTSVKPCLLTRWALNNGHLILDCSGKTWRGCKD